MQNWTGIAYKIPRNLLDTCSENKNLSKCMNQTGVYFLFGEDKDAKKVFYIGQASLRKNGKSFSQRLNEHKKNPEKDYWSEAIIVTTKDDTLGHTEISYLENKFYSMALDAERYTVKNDDDPNPGNITEEKESELSEFAENTKILIGVFGHTLFNKIVKTSEPIIHVEDAPVFYFKGKFKAKATITEEGFVVLKGSEISTKIQDCAKDGVRNKRKEFQDKITKDGRVLADLLFCSPSAAASFVTGGSSSGNACWLTEKGLCPKDLNI